MHVLTRKCRDCGTTAEAAPCPVCGGEVGTFCEDLGKWVTPEEAERLRREPPRPPSPPPPAPFPAVAPLPRKPAMAAPCPAPAPVGRAPARPAPPVRKRLRWIAPVAVAAGILIGGGLLLRALKTAPRQSVANRPMPELLLLTLNAGRDGDDATFQAGIRQMAKAPGVNPRQGDPRAAGSHIQRALASLRKRNYPEADRSFGLACAATPFDLGLREQYVDNLVRQRQFSRARQVAWETLILEPRNPGVWVLLGRASACLGWETEGITAYAIGMCFCPDAQRKTLLNRHQKAAHLPAEQRTLQALTTHWKISGL